MIKQSPKGEDDLYIYITQHLPSSFNWVNITYIKDLLA